MTGSTPLPPLPPPRLEDLRGPANSKTPLVVATVIALVAGSAFALLWLGARSSAADATTERDIALTERDSANHARISAETSLQATQDELSDALDDASANTDDESKAEQVETLQTEVDALAAEVERLEEANDTLATDLADTEEALSAAQEQLDAAEPDPDDSEATITTEPPEDEPAPETTVAPPTVSAKDIGNQLSSLFRRSVLGAQQKTCLGEVMLNEFGAQRVVDAIAAEKPGDDDEFVKALRDAAAFCNIDPSAIFG